MNLVFGDEAPGTGDLTHSFIHRVFKVMWTQEFTQSWEAQKALPTCEPTWLWYGKAKYRHGFGWWESRPRGVSKAHTTGKWQSRDVNSTSTDPTSHGLFSIPCHFHTWAVMRKWGISAKCIDHDTEEGCSKNSELNIYILSVFQTVWNVFISGVI